MTAPIVWNGRNASVECPDGSIDFAIHEKDDQGRFVFFHVCCDCRGTHQVVLHVKDGVLHMNWMGRQPDGLKEAVDVYLGPATNETAGGL